MPSFARGPEIEITTMREVEVLKHVLAKIKIHIPTKSLERGIVMPRDLDNYHPTLPKVGDHLMQNPFKEEDNGKKKKKKKRADDANKKMMRGADNTRGERDLMAGGPLGMNEKFEYNVYEFGNFPMRQDPQGQWIPKHGKLRMMLPSDADWTGKKPELDEEQEAALIRAKKGI